MILGFKYIWCSSATGSAHSVLNNNNDNNNNNGIYHRPSFWVSWAFRARCHNTSTCDSKYLRCNLLSSIIGMPCAILDYELDYDAFMATKLSQWYESTLSQTWVSGSVRIEENFEFIEKKNNWGSYLGNISQFWTCWAVVIFWLSYHVCTLKHFLSFIVLEFLVNFFLLRKL